MAAFTFPRSPTPVVCFAFDSVFCDFELLSLLCPRCGVVVVVFPVFLLPVVPASPALFAAAAVLGGCSFAHIAVNFSVPGGPTPLLPSSAHPRYWLSLALRPQYRTRLETRNLSVLPARRAGLDRKQRLSHPELLLFVVSLVSFVSTTTTYSYGVFRRIPRLPYRGPLSGTAVYLQFCHSSRTQVRPWILSAITSKPIGPAALRRTRRCWNQAAAVTGTTDGQLPRL